jgi:hypothetical protein
MVFRPNAPGTRGELGLTDVGLCNEALSAISAVGTEVCSSGEVVGEGDDRVRAM